MMELVVPAAPRGLPATTTIWSPVWAHLLPRTRLFAISTNCWTSLGTGLHRGMTP